VRQARSAIRCAECGAEVDELAAGWGAYLADDLDDEEDEVLLFCPECARREFGPFDAGLSE
jgi:DNA-directed RNA polymerase subunit RPC12/RpoP